MPPICGSSAGVAYTFPEYVFCRFNAKAAWAGFRVYSSSHLQVPFEDTMAGDCLCTPEGGDSWVTYPVGNFTRNIFSLHTFSLGLLDWEIFARNWFSGRLRRHRALSTGSGGGIFSMLFLTPWQDFFTKVPPLSQNARFDVFNVCSAWTNTVSYKPNDSLTNWTNDRRYSKCFKNFSRNV